MMDGTSIEPDSNPAPVESTAEPPPLKLMWLGRAVKVVDFTRDDGLAIRQVTNEDREKGLRMVAVAGLRYVDDGTPLFKSTAEVGAIPNRLSFHLDRLALAAMQHNDPTLGDGTNDPLP